MKEYDVKITETLEKTVTVQAESQPETFVRMGRSIMALPLPDDMVKKEDAPVKADSVPHKSNPDRDVL